MREEPVRGVVALADGEHEVAVGVEGGVPLPQAVLPVPVLGQEEPAGVPRVGVGHVKLRCRPVRDADLPQRGARPRGLEHEVAGVDGARRGYRHGGSVHEVAEDTGDPGVQVVHPFPDVADAEAAVGGGPRPELVPLHPCMSPGSKPAGRQPWMIGSATKEIWAELETGGRVSYLALCCPGARLARRGEPDVGQSSRLLLLVVDAVSDPEPPRDGASLAWLCEVR